MKAGKARKLFRETGEWAETLIKYFVFILLIGNLLTVNAKAISGSMESTIMTGSRVVASRVTYLFREPARFDIIFFIFPDDETREPFLKRIIGLPGEKVEIIEGRVYINDSETPLDEPFLKVEAHGNYGPFFVPENSYFVLGDNRNISYDSKDWVNKYVARDKILGVAYFEYFPKPQLLK